jgi:hypothetical protein
LQPFFPDFQSSLITSQPSITASLSILPAPQSSLLSSPYSLSAS